MTLTHEMQRNIAPGPVLLLGAPGVGKGTQAQLLVESLGVPQVSTGDLIRDNIARSTPMGVHFRDLVAAGLFVPDDVVNQMVKARLSQDDTERGYILDGYPRTLNQAQWLDAHLESRDIAAPVPVVAVSIEVRYDELLRRVTGRRMAPVSKRIYNIYTHPPRSPGVCDVDGEPLVQRPDDTEDVFAERMKVFSKLTAPVIEHYRSLGRFEVVDGDQAVGQVTEGIVAALERLRHGVKEAAWRLH